MSNTTCTAALSSGIERRKWANFEVPRVWLEQAPNQPCPGKVLDGTGISVVPCGEKLVSWSHSQSAAKCRACQEWRNWQYNGDKVRCDCISGEAPGHCKACAPVEFAARLSAGKEAKRLKRKNAGGLSKSEAANLENSLEQKSK